MDIPEKQFKHAFPPFPHCEYPSAANGYGWRGSGFGWQLEPFEESDTTSVGAASTQRTSEVPAPEILTYDEPDLELDEDDIPSSFRSQSQNFYNLRDENMRNGTLFEDSDFPAEDSSVCYNKYRPSFKDVTWLRPRQLVESPQLFVDGHSRFDVMQGSLQNCWFAAGVANLAMHRNLLMRVVPEDQSFQENYAGIFRFRFWRYGKWVDVVIDDRLPTNKKNLIFMKSPKRNEFWCALLEKAYAKLKGNYQALEFGYFMEGMRDFTGGLPETFNLNGTKPSRIFKILMKAFDRHSLAGVLIFPGNNKNPDVMQGLRKDHVYTITHVRRVQTSDQREMTQIIRLRNPHGHTEWTGDWSDKSPKWELIPQDVKNEIHVKKEDGEFWMSFVDFHHCCDHLEICNLTPDSLSADQLADPDKKRWDARVFKGHWVYGLSAGGPNKNEYNPQYRITLTGEDEDETDSKCTLVIALMQKYQRALKWINVAPVYIGFVVYLIPSNYRGPERLDRKFFESNQVIAKTPSHVNLREVTGRFRLTRGTYCIIPSTSKQDQEKQFLLRVFTEKKIEMKEFGDSIEFVQMDDMVCNRIFTPEEAEMNKCTQRVFLKLSDENMEVNWLQVKEILDSALKGDTENKGFPEDVCRIMVALLDHDHSGKLDYQQFKKLWADIKNWRAAFKLHDEETSGTLSGFQLREALRSAGYHVTNRVLTDLVHRYGNKQNELNFVFFILCALKVKTMIELFNSRDPEKINTAKFNLGQWLHFTLYC